MTNFQGRVMALGKRYKKSGAPDDVLKFFHEERRWTQRKMAKSLGVSPQALMYWMKKYKIIRDCSRFQKSILQTTGYNTLDDYFLDEENTKKTFAEMARETGFSLVTVAAHYKKFCNSLKKEISYDKEG